MNKIFDHSKARIAAAGVVAAILLILTGLAVKADGLYGLEAGFRHSHQPASGRQSSDPEGDPFSEMGKRPSYPASSDPDPLPDGMFYPCSPGSDPGNFFPELPGVSDSLPGGNHCLWKHQRRPYFWNTGSDDFWPCQLLCGELPVFPGGALGLLFSGNSGQRGGQL